MVMRMDMGPAKDEDRCSAGLSQAEIVELPGKMGKSVTRNEETPSSDRLHNRLQATLAGLEELDILRERHGMMVEDVRKMLAASSSSSSLKKQTAGSMTSTNLHKKSAATSRGPRVEHAKTEHHRETPQVLPLVLQRNTTDQEVHSCPECDLLKQRLKQTTRKISGFGVDGHTRRHSDPCNILIAGRERRLQQKVATKEYFSLPREFSGTTYNFPSPMHAVLLQYHWTAGSGDQENQGTPATSATSPTKEEWPCTLPDRYQTKKWSSELDNPSDHTKMMGLPFMFLREQTKPENNSLESLRESRNNAENLNETCHGDFDEEEEDTLSSMLSLSSRSTLSSRSSFSSLKSLRSLKLKRFSLTSSLEEGYFSRPDTPNSRTSSDTTNSQSEISACSNGSESSGIEQDLPEAFRMLEKNLKPTRLTGFDDSWVEALSQIPQLKDSAI